MEEKTAVKTQIQIPKALPMFINSLPKHIQYSNTSRFSTK